jgi:hypothetical protein
MAPVNIIPSMAILITPARSQRIPLKAPKAIGAARKSEAEIIPNKFIEVPRAAQVKKAKMKISETTNNARLTCLKPLANCQPPTKATITVKNQSVVWVGSIQSSKSGAFVRAPGLRPKVVVISLVVFRANKPPMPMATMRKKMPMPTLRFSRIRGVGMDKAVVLISFSCKNKGISVFSLQVMPPSHE